MEIDKIATLSLQPDDVLVLNYGGKLSEKLHVLLQESLRRIKLANQVIILEQGMTLQVLNPALKWTSDLPTQEGWYWVKVCHGQRPIVVHHVDGRITAPNEKYAMHVGKFEAYKWYGPIELPEHL